MLTHTIFSSQHFAVYNMQVFLESEISKTVICICFMLENLSNVKVYLTMLKDIKNPVDFDSHNFP